MYSFSVFIFIIVFFAYPSNSLNYKGDECIQDGPCTCNYPNGLEINLKNLSSNSYIFTSGSNYYMYFYAPCVNIPIHQKEPDKKSAVWFFNATLHNGSSPLDPAKVANDEINGTFTALGSAETAKFELTQFGGNSATLEYELSGTKTQVELDCAEGKPNVFILNPTAPPSNLTHSLILRGDIACPRLSVPEVHYLSTGSVLVIIFLTFVIIYLVGGMLLLKYLRGAEGLEMIPNVESWRSLISLVRDGIKYATTCRSDADSYERI